MGVSIRNPETRDDDTRISALQQLIARRLKHILIQ